MHLDFNAGLKHLAERRGLGYFDLVTEMAQPGSASTIPKLDERFRPAGFDHHVADTVFIRRMHYNAVGAAFGLNVPVSALPG